MFMVYKLKTGIFNFSYSVILLILYKCMLN